MKHSKVIFHCIIEITESSPFIPYELAHNYDYGYARKKSTFSIRNDYEACALYIFPFGSRMRSSPIPVIRVVYGTGGNNSNQKQNDNSKRLRAKAMRTTKYQTEGLLESLQRKTQSTGERQREQNTET